MSEEKILLLTGASRGIGHAAVKRFSKAGWRVVSCSRQEFDPRCPWPSGEADHLVIDLSNPLTLHRSVEDLKQRLNGAPLHALVNNAAMSPKDAQSTRMGTLDTDMNLWQQVFQVNFFAPIQLARALFDELKAGQGSIVNVTSIAGSRVHPFAGSAYATSKAALAALTREMASDFAPHGIRVNAIAPGEINTSILSPGTEKIVETIPQRRLGKAEEVAETIFFLCNDTASYINGAEIAINGGQHV